MRYFFLLGLIVLAACAPARLDRSSYANVNVISNFLPDKGEAASYKVGEQVRFGFLVSQSGYLTLISYGATGNTVPLESNLQLSTGKHVFPRADDRQGSAQAAYVVGTPTGNNRVILIYTNAPIKTLPRGKFDQGQLDAAVRTAIESSRASQVDLAETAIEVTP